ncbi:MAG: hypothetical protein LAT61_11230 [Alcanivorax sp.]|nr:hypothetical protein [Alcanivorax sp.]
MAAWPVHPAVDHPRPLGLTATLLLSSVLWLVTGSTMADGRPVMSEYDDAQAFVADMLAWRQGAMPDRAPRADAAPQQPALGEGMKPWHRVTGPEDLEQAVDNARGYEQPRYREPRRFERTTHISFPLPPLPADSMAREALASEPTPTRGTDYSAISIPERLMLAPDMLAPKDTDSGYPPKLEVRAPEPHPVQVQLR